ncbi:MAG: dynamin family protein [Terriglobales bacterium]
MLAHLAEIATEVGETGIASAVHGLSERLSEGRFYVACIGQFKRGKSTLINALVGEEVLPAGAIPVTSAPTIIRHGPRGARIQRQGAWTTIPVESIADYVSEDRNPSNAKRVTGAEIFLPSPILANGLCLVDTPGLGSVHAANTAATHELVPHIDAALVVLGADPPLAGEELKLLEAVAHEVPALLFVLNKADRTSAADRAAAASFTRRVVQARLGRGPHAMFEVSALQQLEGRGEERDWLQLVAALGQLARDSKRSLLRAASGRGSRRAAQQLLAAVHEQQAALGSPLAVSEARLKALQQTLGEAARTLRDLGVLLLAEQRRLTATFADRRNAFLHDECSVARRELLSRLAKMRKYRHGPRYRRALMHAAQEVARVRLLPWLQAEAAHADAVFREMARRFAAMGNEFLHRLAASGVAGLEDLPEDLEDPQGLLASSHFQFHLIERVAAPASPLLFLADFISLALGQRGPILRAAEAFLDQLLEVNSARVQADVAERTVESRKRLEALVEQRLRNAAALADRAFARARQAQAEGRAAVAATLARLADIEQELLPHCPP